MLGLFLGKLVAGLVAGLVTGLVTVFGANFGPPNWAKVKSSGRTARAGGGHSRPVGTFLDTPKGGGPDFMDDFF